MQDSLGFIGGGKMATAMIKGLLHRKYPREKILVSDPDPKRRHELAGLGVKTFVDNRELPPQVDGLVLAVKPQVAPEVLRTLTFPRAIPLLSIVAGLSTTRLEELAPNFRVLRAMPNVPALIQEGITVLTAGKSAGKNDLKWGEQILAAFGRVVQAPEEQMNAVTALSGSGPGFVFRFIEALIDAGVLTGLPRTLATELAVQTVLGSTKMLAELGDHPASLRDMVTSPGGTTINGLLELEAGGFAGLIMKAVSSAKKRAEELG